MTKTNFLHQIMNVNFNISIDADDFMVVMKSNEIEALNLCGGIPWDGLESILFSADYDYPSKSLYVSRESELFEANRSLYWNDRFIDNTYLNVFSTGTGLGVYIFINQIIQAQKLGIEYFTVSAAKSNKYNGYYTWARFGYSMDNPMDEKTLKELLTREGRQEMDLFELMKTRNGRNFWKEKGFWWQGKFNVLPGSINIQAFNDYLHQAGINLSL